ncbi:hypothetical protein GA0061096_0044 [Fictibacillus enclensis]|uniref:ChrB N-terminal domain-containing protein n=1 Tax=Fictibacillus enclensis TaxID=1017270 RepID=A0A0V8JAI1_9BACL|nr:Chromate resistance protein ChrB [Fictibacillus enclensis]KSU84035.1 hypothetical protein AS030_00215 [Fictibacillus enclensis]SCB72141.1 hypothetical protein GA0061096_0044 [Fictibacillus enclensis]
MEESRKWYLFSYKVPVEPSTLRVRIWRNLKALGVLYIQQSVCLVPKVGDIGNKLTKLHTLIKDHGGESFMMEILKFSDYSEEELIKMFNEQRSKEYHDWLESCRHFGQDMDREAANSSAYYNIDESEMELMRLKRQLRKILKRDYFNYELSFHAKACLKQCEENLYSLAEAEYKLEGVQKGK